TTRLFGRFAALAPLAFAALALASAAAHAFTVSGRFLYEDRLFDGNGYTGAVQNLPIRHALVEVVDAVTQQTLASGSTGADGTYSLSVTGQVVPVNLFVRATTDGRPAGYELRVVDNFTRIPTGGGLILTGSQLYSISTGITLAHPPANNLAEGDYLIQDPDGTGVAQAFNIFDCGVDFFDWVALAAVHGALPTSTEFLVYAWKATGTPGNPPPAFGSNYSQNGIFIGADPSGGDTDGWSDTVILHETGHWFDDNFSRSDNPGGAHFIGDNNANVLLAYGEGSATYHCAKVREWRATSHLNLLGQPVDRLVSLYADLVIPPPVGTPGGLSFSYDFETGNFGDTGAPIGQRGSANETNVTSALWDMVDGPSTPDATPGIDDESFETTDTQAYGIEHVYLPGLPAGNSITVEDYYQGWFARNGAGYQKPGMDEIFVTLAKMPFYPDAAEPDDAIASARPITPVAYGVTAGGRVVINELELGAADAIELMNTGDVAVDLTGWQIEVFANGTTQDPTRVYTFPPFTLEAGECVAVHEGNDATSNGRYHLYSGDRTAFNASWNPGLDGACYLRDAAQTPVDFVRWRDSNGIDNGTPTPAGLAYNGLLDSPTAPNGLARDVNGTDTDQASDWHAGPTTLGCQNHPSPQAHTIFGIGDKDVVSFVAAAGQRYGFEARCEFSASDARLEVLSPGGTVIASNDNSDASVRDARVDFLAPENETYYVRATHVGTNTDWAEYTLLGFARPQTSACAGPAGLNASAAHATDSQDLVQLHWSNGAVYDSVHVYRNGTLVDALPGAANSYQFHEDRGLYQYGVSGTSGECGETAIASDYAFAGIVDCVASDGFEDGNAALWIKEANGWGVTPFAKTGTWAFTDSPVGTYHGCPTGASGCKNNAIAVFGVPADVVIPGYATLEFDQICITEHCEPEACDRGLVEISDDDGGSWTTIAAYDAGSDPAWSDDVAGPDDWRHASLDLSAFAGKRINVRFRLESDANLEFDGWYLDNLEIAACPPVGVDPTPRTATVFAPPSPNPLVRGGTAVLEYALGTDLAAADGTAEVSIELHSVAGRLVRVLERGPKTLGVHRVTWNGTDGRGISVPPGMYYATLRVGKTVRTTRLVVIG
ncbi:MAG: lamin tail domain-containing protein, partial [Candidatus Eisenbacteria bacterium]